MDHHLLFKQGSCNRASGRRDELEPPRDLVCDSSGAQNEENVVLRWFYW